MERQRYRYRERTPEEGRPPETEKQEQWARTEKLRKEAEDLLERIGKLKGRIREEKEQRDKEAEELITKVRIAAGEIEYPEVKEKPSFPTMEEWLKEVVIDPSFFMTKPRSDRLSCLLEGLEATTVIVPTAFYNILRVRYERGKIIENVETEEYYPRLLDIIRQWEIPIPVERRKILNWISSADFWELLSKFFERKVMPATEYLTGESRFNPIDIRAIKKVLGETVGQAFYEMIAVSEKSKRAVISATHGFVRLCRRVRIPTYESYTEWKKDFKRQHGFGGRFFIILAAGAAGSIAEVALGMLMLPDPIRHTIAYSFAVIVFDG